MYGTVSMGCVGHTNSMRGDWRPYCHLGGRRKCSWQEKTDTTEIDSFHLFCSWRKVDVLCQTWRGHPTPLCQLGGKPFLVTAVSQMDGVPSHVTSPGCNCSNFCSVVADPLTSVFQPCSYVRNAVFWGCKSMK